MVRLVDDLMDVSRITSGKVQLQRQPTPLAELVHSAVDANRAAIDAAGLTLTVTLPDTPCVLEVDPTRFVQVLSNLLHNSTKFTQRGGTIDLRASVDDDVSRPRLAIAVTDSGDGIDAATLPHVFDFFVQGAVPGRGKSGLGIGLGLAKQLVEMHGGTIEAESPGPGRGSTFTIRVPIVAWEPAPASKGDAADAHAFAGRHVLVIDDNVDAADMLAGLVIAHGGEAVTAYGGRDGLRIAADFGPDVILLDIGMPEMDGYETCRRLRAQPAGAEAYIVAVTGWGQASDRERALAEGFDAHLTKPADPRMLADLMAHVPRSTARRSEPA
jgi:CheY-like chemotaxis protein